MDKSKRSHMSLNRRMKITGWIFIVPAALLILIFSFYPMIGAVDLSLKHGAGLNLTWFGLNNYLRIFKDAVFLQTMLNTFFYLLVQVPVMLGLALILASVLNDPSLRFKGLFRTMIFLPCATSLVSYSMIFRSLFSADGFINAMLTNFGFSAVGWFQNPWTARFVIIIALVWRWTGYNMVFYLAGLQNIDPTVYEAARLDGANFFKTFTKITLPLLRPTILLTIISSINGTLQLFDESMNLTNGGPGRSTMSMSHYIYNTAFVQNPNFSYASALSVAILFFVATLSLIQMKVGDKRD